MNDRTRVCMPRVIIQYKRNLDDAGDGAIYVGAVFSSRQERMGSSVQVEGLASGLCAIELHG